MGDAASGRRTGLPPGGANSTSGTAMKPWSRGGAEKKPGPDGNHRHEGWVKRERQRRPNDGTRTCADRTIPVLSELSTGLRARIFPGCSRYATLAVRDGWMTYTMSCSAFLGSYQQDKNPPALDDVTDRMKTDTKATLDELKG